MVWIWLSVFKTIRTKWVIIIKCVLLKKRPFFYLYHCKGGYLDQRWKFHKLNYLGEDIPENLRTVFDAIGTIVENAWYKLNGDYYELIETKEGLLVALLLVIPLWGPCKSKPILADYFLLSCLQIESKLSSASSFE